MMSINYSFSELLKGS